MLKKSLVALSLVFLCLLISGGSLQADVVYDHWSPFTLLETITDVGGGLYEYSYEFVNADVDGIWHVLVYTDFELISPEPFHWGHTWTAEADSVDDLGPEYDARNLDPAIIGYARTWGPDSPCSTNPLPVGEYVDGFSFITDVFDPSPKYYAYDLQCNWAPTSGSVSAIGLTTTEHASLVGTWTLNSFWEKATAEITFYAEGFFIDSFGYGGDWLQFGYQVYWDYNLDPYSIYYGLMSEDGDLMAGEMTNIYEEEGTWDATRNVHTGCPPMTGFWGMNSFWGKEAVIIAFHADGTFDDSEGFHGDWEQDDCSVNFTFPSGTHYWGVMHSDGIYMSGQMLSAAEMPGIWDADRIFEVCRDDDLDGYAIEGYPCGPVDCDDADADVHPRAMEACNGIDDDCDSFVPDDEADTDSDGWRICEGDCDDKDGSVNPAAPEVPDNGIDDNCNGQIDEGCFIGVIM